MSFQMPEFCDVKNKAKINIFFTMNAPVQKVTLFWGKNKYKQLR